MVVLEQSEGKLLLLLAHSLVLVLELKLVHRLEHLGFGTQLCI